MKRFLLAFLLAFALLAIPASAHPGGTDENGGHYDRSDGSYHYHHGYPAHRHTGGSCPYDFDDRTGESSGASSSGSSSSGSGDSHSVSEEDRNFRIACWSVFPLAVAFLMIASETIRVIVLHILGFAAIAAALFFLAEYGEYIGVALFVLFFACLGISALVNWIKSHFRK